MESPQFRDMMRAYTVCAIVTCVMEGSMKRGCGIRRGNDWQPERRREGGREKQTGLGMWANTFVKFKYACKQLYLGAYVVTTQEAGRCFRDRTGR